MLPPVFIRPTDRSWASRQQEHWLVMAMRWFRQRPRLLFPACAFLQALFVKYMRGLLRFYAPSITAVQLAYVTLARYGGVCIRNAGVVAGSHYLASEKNNFFRRCSARDMLLIPAITSSVCAGHGVNHMVAGTYTWCNAL